MTTMENEKILVLTLIFLSLVINNCIQLVDSVKPVGEKGVCIKCEKNMDPDAAANETIHYNFGSCDRPSIYNAQIGNGYELNDTEYEECSTCYSQTRGPLVKRGCAPAPSPKGIEVQCVKDNYRRARPKSNENHIHHHRPGCWCSESATIYDLHSLFSDRFFQ
ncbi:unnamed protein product [Allacma fusca]|uniref:Secreted protein n=1 Tax=Allacma fusca TaxID=39272 RepID=A0A8J2P0T7_9HEXA|nr:unnamed protein product [Allacma fusca]